jgi:hypothetical protein
MQGVTDTSHRKSPITFVTEFFGAESYRFFLGTGPDLRYELAFLPAVDRKHSAADGFERGRDGGDLGAVVRRRLGGRRWRAAGAPG